MKRVRQDAARREANRTQRSRARTLMKKVREAEDPTAARALLNETKSYLDRLATKGLLKKNQVANYKGQLERHVNTLEA